MAANLLLSALMESELVWEYSTIAHEVQHFMGCEELEWPGFKPLSKGMIGRCGSGSTHLDQDQCSYKERSKVVSKVDPC